ncbi:hypothetical protein OEV98_06620 [Caldibacillus lycopersici]|uniref:Uncharacterized protein n=1 Tax=Perspicuibacillus lycopersici TaxID=1325689 RepID=A0AAE3LQ93_9BACI|nr:CBO0543 family protein [Perspicuibacillus lycopersici]MCU9613224.1 hypothetical protein [Perspicuibacillus lycopersici]
MLEHIRVLEDKLYKIELDDWIKNEVFTWEWWILLCFFVLPWVLWWRLAKREAYVEAFLFGILVLFITTILDIIGLRFNFWEYPTVLLPVLPKGFPFDFSMVPVAYMFIYQYTKTWKAFSLLLLVMALLYAFVGEPFCLWTDLVAYDKWHLLNSFIYYLIIGIFIRYFLLKMVAYQNSSG